MTDEHGIGLIIRRARQRKGLTQEALAHAVGVDRSAVSNWETEKHLPLRYAGKVEEVLGIVIPSQPPVTALDDLPDEIPA